MSPPPLLAVRVRGRSRDGSPRHGRFAAVADTVSNAQQNPGRLPALGGARPEGRRVRPDQGDPRPPPDLVRAGDVLGDVERALLLQVLQGAPGEVRSRRQGHPARPAAGRYRRAGRRRRRRRWLGGHVQDREPQPPVLRRAVPGRSDRRRRHRPRHPRHGRPPDRRDGRAALRRPRRSRHRPRDAGDRRRRRRLRQLPRPAQHRRRGGVRPHLLRQPAGQRPVRRRAAARGHAPRVRLRHRQQGDPLRRCHRRRRHRRRVHPRLGDLRGRRPGEASGRAGGRPVHGEAADRVHAGAVRSRHHRRHPGPGCSRHLLRHLRAGQRR